MEDETCEMCGLGLDDMGDCKGCHYPADTCDCQPQLEFDDGREQQTL